MIYKGLMATKTIYSIEDDIDGTPNASTVTFALEGAVYEIDLSDKHVTQLRKAMELFVEHARRQRGAAAVGGRTRRANGLLAQNGLSAGTVREWAQEQGIEVSDRGRIPDAIVEQYTEALKNPAKPRARRSGAKASAGK